jgi:hypothetical protein
MWITLYKEKAYKKKEKQGMKGKNINVLLDEDFG